MCTQYEWWKYNSSVFHLCTAFVAPEWFYYYFFCAKQLYVRLFSPRSSILQHICTFCWMLRWFSSLRWNHKVYTTLEYKAIIMAKEIPTTTDKIMMKASIQISGQVGTHKTLPFFTLVFFARNSGILTIPAKIQLPGIIIWNHKL